MVHSPTVHIVNQLGKLLCTTTRADHEPFVVTRKQLGPKLLSCLAHVGVLVCLTSKYSTAYSNYKIFVKGYLEFPLVPSLLAFTCGNTHLIILPKSGALRVRAAFMLSQ